LTPAAQASNELTSHCKPKPVSALIFRAASLPANCRHLVARAFSALLIAAPDARFARHQFNTCHVEFLLGPFLVGP